MERGKRQFEILDAMKEYIEVNKIPPTIRELCDIIGLKSTSSMWMHIKKLQKQGYIDMIDSSPRSIKIEKITQGDNYMKEIELLKKENEELKIHNENLLNENSKLRVIIDKLKLFISGL